MKAVHIFLGVDMRMGHPGLMEFAKKNGVKLDALEIETAAVFISRDRYRMKAWSYNGVLSYMRAVDKKRPFDMQSIHEFPKAFRKDGTMDYPQALRLRLEKELGKKGKLEDLVL